MPKFVTVERDGRAYIVALNPQDWKHVGAWQICPIQCGGIDLVKVADVTVVDSLAIKAKVKVKQSQRPMRLTPA